MKAVDFILNGGLMGLMSGFDHRKEGHVYGFEDLNDDIKATLPCLKLIGSAARFLAGLI